MKFSAILLRSCVCVHLFPLNRFTIRIVCAYYHFFGFFFFFSALTLDFALFHRSCFFPFTFFSVFFTNLPVYWVKWIQAWNWVCRNGSHMYGTFFYYYNNICICFCSSTSFSSIIQLCGGILNSICVYWLMRSHSKWQSAYICIYREIHKEREITFNFKTDKKLYTYTSHCHSAHVWFSWASSNRTAKASSFSLLKGLHCYASWTR